MNRTRHAAGFVPLLLTFWLGSLAVCGAASASEKPTLPTQREDLPASWQLFTNDVGITTCVINRPGTEYTTIVVTVPFGKCCVPDRLAGGARLLARWMQGGTKTLTERKMAYRLGRLSGEVQSFTNYDVTIFHANVKAENTAEALKIILDIVYRPRLKNSVFHRTKKFMLHHLEVEREVPSAVFRRRTLSALFPDHAFGRPTAGTPRGLRLCMPMALRCLHGLYFSPSKTVLVVVGPVVREDLQPVLTKVPAWMQSANVSVLRKPLKTPAERDHKIDSPAKDQGFVFVGSVLESPISLEKRLMLELLRELMVGLNGRATSKLRKEKGLTYAPGTLRDYTSAGGLWGLTVATPRGTEKEALAMLKDTLTSVAESPPTASEMDTAREAVTTLLAQASEQNHLLGLSVANRLAYDIPVTDYRREKQFIQSVTPAALARLVSDHFSADRLVSVVAD